MRNVAELAILFEHPEWFQLLFNERARRGIPFAKVPAQQLLFDPEEESLPAPVILNRMSPSAWKRNHGNGIFAVKEYLRHVEARGAVVINGTPAYAVETSKALQLDIFRKVGVAYPRARVINHASQALPASDSLRFPVVVKANIGGSGAGIFKFDSPGELKDGVFDLGVDSTALVQEFLPARDSCITRVEVLNGEFLYAIQITTDFSNFNLCPADICQRDGTPQPSMEVCPAEAPKKLKVVRADPPREVIEAALALAREARLDVGGIEYLIDDRDGRAYFYDINALSNFVSDAVNVVGFDPTARFVDYIETRLPRAAANHTVNAS
jgi:glutathione synthase/RimK-type ligase-like ATP-grasp enzyme